MRMKHSDQVGPDIASLKSLASGRDRRRSIWIGSKRQPETGDRRLATGNRQANSVEQCG